MIKIGTRFYKTPHRKTELELVDILSCYSEKDGKFVKEIYIAKPVNSLSNNEFYVSQTTILRNLK